MSAYRSQRLQPRRRSPSALVIGLVVLAALVIGFVLGNLFRDRGVADGSPSPSGPAGASGSLAASASVTAPGASGNAQPTAVVSAPEEIIPPGSVVSVLVDGLRMRHEPSTDSTLIDELPADQLVAVGYAQGVGAWGPVEADGFTWYPVRRLSDLTDLPPLPDGLVDLEGEFGWAAAGDESGPYLELLPPRCPAHPVDLATLEAMQPWEQLACFGSEQITIEGVFGCPGCGGLFPGTFEPAWLTSPININLISVDPSARLGPFALRFPPDVEVPDAASIIRVTGHFDDAAAADCAVAPGEPPEPADAETAELYCREQFVVESLEVTGTDPDFPSS